MPHTLAVCAPSHRYPYRVLQTALRFALNHLAQPQVLLLGRSTASDVRLRNVPFRRFDWETSELFPVKTYRLKKASALAAIWDGEDAWVRQQIKLALKKHIPALVILVEEHNNQDYALHVELHPEEFV